MADRQKLLDALYRADQEGDTEAAAMFAEDIRKLDAESAANPPRDVKAEYDEMPWYKQAGQATADSLRLLSNGLTFGFRDKMAAAAGIGGDDYESALAAQRAETGDARTRAGSAAMPLEVLGGATTGGAASKMGLSLLDRVPATLPLWQRMLGASAAGAGEGVAYGALDALGNDRDVREGAKNGMIAGGIMGPVGELITTGANRLMGRGIGNDVAPTADELRSRSKELRQEVEDIGAEYNPQAIARLNDSIDTKIAKGPSGARRVRHPATFGEIDELARYSNNQSPQGMTLYDLDQHRQAIRKNVGRHTDASEAEMGRRMINELDDFAKGATPADVSSRTGSADDALAALTEARSVDHRRLKMKEINKLMTSAERRADASSAASTGNQLRSKLATFLDNDMKTGGYSPEEIRQMEAIVKGTKLGNFLRSTGQQARSIPGHVIGGAVGSAAGAPFGQLGIGAGAALGIGTSNLAGKALGGLAEAGTKRQANRLVETIARGGQAARPRVAPQMMDDAERAMLERLMILMGMEEASPAN